MSAADTGSFTKASQKLGVSASAVSKSVLRLEERLKTRLFHRSTRSVTLTAEGKIFLDRCKRIAGEMRAAEDELAQVREAPRGNLIFSMPSAVLPFLPKFAQFQKQYPEIKLEIVCTDRQVDVIDEGYDTVLRYGESNDSRLMVKKIGTYRQVIIGSSDYFKNHTIPKTPADLTGHNCVMYRSHVNGKLLPWPIQYNGKEVDTDALATTITNLLEPQIVFVRESVGLACVPDIAVKDELRSGKMKSVLEEFTDGPVTFYILWPTNRHLTPKIRVFVDFVTNFLFKS